MVLPEQFDQGILLLLSPLGYKGLSSSWPLCHGHVFKKNILWGYFEVFVWKKPVFDMHVFFFCISLNKNEKDYCWDFRVIFFGRGCLIIISTGLNIKIGIIQKVYEWSSCPFAKMILLWGDHFVKTTALSLIYFLKNAYLDI